jgi:hypothetical protein
MESPFACEMNALTPKQRQRHSELLHELMASQHEIVELPDGYSLRFSATPQLFQSLAEFVVYEHLCCPFFDLDLSLERENGPLWLRLRGRPGVKEFIRSELNLSQLTKGVVHNEALTPALSANGAKCKSPGHRPGR